jgi:hypothetical protein
MEWSKIQCLLIREKLCLDPATLATDIASTTRCATDWAEHRPRHGPCRTLLRSCLSESCADHWDLTWVNLGYPWLSNVCFSPFFLQRGNHILPEEWTYCRISKFQQCNQGQEGLPCWHFWVVEVVDSPCCEGGSTLLGVPIPWGTPSYIIHFYRWIFHEINKPFMETSIYNHIESKGWMRVLARLRTISLQVSISGARLKMFYFQNLSQIKNPGNAARDGWKIGRSRVLTGWLSFAD